MTITPEYVHFMPETKETGRLYISHEFGCVIHVCPCGCGKDASTPIKPMWSDGWDLAEHDDATVTLHPSILNPCGAHYWIRKNVIVWA
jgi:hypothetical protein